MPSPLQAPQTIDSEYVLRYSIYDYVNFLIDVNHGKICVPQTVEFGPIGGKGWHQYNPDIPPSFDEYQLVISPVPSANDFPTKQFKQVVQALPFVDEEGRDDGSTVMVRCSFHGFENRRYP